MIDYWKTPFTMEESLDTLNLFVRKWFEGKYKQLTPPQKYSLKLLKDHKNMLITAPTGSGKTEAAVLPVLN